jgi:hypothetical protein
MLFTRQYEVCLMSVDLKFNDEFCALVLEFTGRPLEYHIRAESTGLEFGWYCYCAGQKSRLSGDTEDER